MQFRQRDRFAGSQREQENINPLSSTAMILKFQLPFVLSISRHVYTRRQQ